MKKEVKVTKKAAPKQPTLEERISEYLTVNQKLIHVIQAERYERQQAELKASLGVNKRNVVQRVLAALRGN